MSLGKLPPTGGEQRDSVLGHIGAQLLGPTLSATEPIATINVNNQVVMLGEECAISDPR